MKYKILKTKGSVITFREKSECEYNGLKLDVDVSGTDPHKFLDDYVCSGKLREEMDEWFQTLPKKD